MFNQARSVSSLAQSRMASGCALIAVAATLATMIASALAADPAASAPKYQTGQKFSYSKNGVTIEQTVTVLPDGTNSWIASDGWQWTKKAYLERARSWKSPKGETGQQIYVSNVDSIFPLQVGKEVTSQYSGTMSNGQSWTGTMKCKVEGTTTRTVPAGTFDTYEIVCRNGKNPDQESYTTITHSYSPKIGADVVYREYTPRENTNDIQQLVSVGG